MSPSLLEAIFNKHEEAKENEEVYVLTPKERSLVREIQRPATEKLIYFFYRVREVQATSEIPLQRNITNAAKTSWVASTLVGSA